MLKRLVPAAAVALALLGLASPASAQQPPQPLQSPVTGTPAPARTAPAPPTASSAPAHRRAATPPPSSRATTGTATGGTAPGGAAPQPPRAARLSPTASVPSVSAAPTGPIQLPYTGAAPLPDSESVRGPAFSSAKLKTLAFASPVKVASGWPSQGVLLANDTTGNGHADLLLFTVKDGSVMITLYEGVGGGKVVNRGYVGNGWNQFDYVTTGDVNGDGRADLIGRERNGDLWLYTARSGGRGFNGGRKIGWAWSVIRSITLMPATAGHMPSIMATDHNGRLYRYPFATHDGKFADKITYAYGWNRINRIMPAGDWDSNHQPDFYAIDSSGRLYMYLAGAKGDTYSSYQIGNGWNVMRQVMGIQARLGSGIYGINRSGELLYYPIRHLYAIHSAARTSPNWGRWVGPRNSIAPMTWSVVPRRGWNGTKVRVVRLALGRGAPLDASMTFDAGTQRAVERFQHRAGLNPSGVVDMATWNRLTNRSWWMDNWEYPPLVNMWASHDQRVEALVRGARSFIGTPYTWGGAGPGIDGADCSGMVLQAMYAAGIDPQPIQAVNDAHPTYRLSKALYSYPRLMHVPFSNRQRGDLVFWSGRYGIYHVAVYVGNNQVIESNYGYARQRPLYDWGRITSDVVRPVAY